MLIPITSLRAESSRPLSSLKDLNSRLGRSNFLVFGLGFRFRRFILIGPTNRSSSFVEVLDSSYGFFAVFSYGLTVSSLGCFPRSKVDFLPSSEAACHPHYRGLLALRTSISFPLSLATFISRKCSNDQMKVLWVLLLQRCRGSFPSAFIMPFLIGRNIFFWERRKPSIPSRFSVILPIILPPFFASILKRQSLYYYD